MMTDTAMLRADSNDANLVAASLNGNRDAFGQIVARYQSLICSLSYSATGNIAQSEDLAQETFITAWNQLPNLREPGKLRSWLCGIARNCINNSFRRQGRTISHASEPLDAIHDASAPDPLPRDEAMTREEEAILWRSLEKIPELYREPLVLFYREGQSIQSVARQLDLSEDVVKQRLSRGRKMLAQEVTGFVEGALKRSIPGKAFTLGVLSALPLFTTSASAAAIGATAVQGSATAKAAGVIGIAGAVLGPLLGILGTWVGYRMAVDDARSDSERDYIKSFYRKLVWCIAGFSILLLFLIFNSRAILQTNPMLLAGGVIGLGVAYLAAMIGLSIWAFRVRRNLFKDARSAVTEIPPRAVFEYKTETVLFGWPLVHIRVGGGVRSQNKPVKAWIAIGDFAIGLLFGFGGIAIAPFSIGGCAIGLVPFGGMAIGILALGGFSLGFWSFGGLAFGYQAYGGVAIAWSAASGGAAVAREFALGGIGHAAEANNRAAQSFIMSQPFFYYSSIVIRYFVWLNMLWFVPMLFWWRRIRRQRN